MKRRWVIGYLLLLSTTPCCVPQEQSTLTVDKMEEADPVESPPYTVLNTPPDAALEEVSALLSQGGDLEHRLFEQFASHELDGQRVVSMLELACYADVTCHATEYPLTIATLDFIEGNLTRAEVVEAVQWISRSYQNEMVREKADDEIEQFRALLVEAMNARMASYAEELLNPGASSSHRKD